VDFGLLDGYLLRGKPAKAEVVRAVLADRSADPRVAPYYEGLEMLGTRTPDLALIALRLALVGKKADDASVVRLRKLTERSRAGGADAERARTLYQEELE
jgi:hypothetical protein